MKFQSIALTAISLSILTFQSTAEATCPPLAEVNKPAIVNKLLLGGQTTSGWHLEIVDTDKTDPAHPLTIGTPLMQQEGVCKEKIRTITVEQLPVPLACTYEVTCHPLDLKKPSSIVGRFTLEK